MSGSDILSKFASGYSMGSKIKEEKQEEKKAETYSNIASFIQQYPDRAKEVIPIAAKLGPDGVKTLDDLVNLQNYETPQDKRRSDTLEGLSKEYASKGYSPDTLGKYAKENEGKLDMGVFAKATQEEQFSMNNPAQMKFAQDLRKEFNSMDDVTNFLKVRTQYQDMYSALKVGKETGNYLPVDQTLITTFNKILDPQSVVRESEYARTPENMSLINRLYGNMQSYVSGGAKLTDNDRQALVRMVKEVTQNRQNAYLSQRDNYGSIATQSRLPKEIVLGQDFSKDLSFDFDEPSSAKVEYAVDKKGSRYTPVYDKSGKLIGYNSN